MKYKEEDSLCDGKLMEWSCAERRACVETFSCVVDDQ
jgi:hypothetical protein